MSPKEKAVALYEKFIQYAPVEFEHDYAIKSSLICVNEIVQSIKLDYEHEWVNERKNSPNFLKYWTKVKQEINEI